MRWLVILVAALATLWSGYWFVGRGALRDGIASAVAAAEARGWRIAWDDIGIGGFPNRFDTTLTEPDVTVPDGTLRWHAPFLQVLALSYRPNEIIAVAPRRMTFAAPWGDAVVTSADLRASGTVSLAASPNLQHGTVVGEALGIDGGAWRLDIARAQLAARQAGTPDAWDLALDGDGIRAGGTLAAALDPAGALPEVVDSLDLDATWVPDGAGHAVDLRRAALVWGALALDATGALEVGADGVPEGTLSLELRGTEAALELLRGWQVVPEARMPLIEAGLAGMTAGDGSVRFDLVLADGRMRLGPIPLGPAPRLPPPSAPPLP
ncbi:DUF2125 domain-containing protein [uncultured Jannaschia sp.]|uniref:DUF2125 domain-containing protein n=1 Tax=uncultured Jannaschia sp. TaxID=293347 RepID=UPI00260FEEAF|nr:DUF2125 domain-containing protein [uncultured Jannaschia sp.]